MAQVEKGYCSWLRRGSWMYRESFKRPCLHGLWFMVQGLVYGLWLEVFGLWFRVERHRVNFSWVRGGGVVPGSLQASVSFHRRTASCSAP